MLMWVTSVAGGRIVPTQESKVKCHEAENEQKNENETTTFHGGTFSE